MARNKPYTFTLAIIDVVLITLTAGLWCFVILVRELYRHNS